MKTRVLWLVLPLVALGASTLGSSSWAKEAPAVRVSKEAQACVDCHGAQSPSFVQEWRHSSHAARGVDCYSCHQASKTAVDAKEHNGFTIKVIVSPNDCARCHPNEVKEMTTSHHAEAGNILDSLDNYLGEVIGGSEAVAVGCLQCHGSKVKVLPGGRFDVNAWPNTGIGRINPDGSKGSCTACHTRHSFSRAQAREPQTCGKCHLGPDHPQIEVYEESKHGILYEANKERLNMQSKRWVVGQDYTAAPTCATCHMSATPNQPVTHDVGARISWTLRPPVSKKLVNADQRRDAMKDVCSSCHSPPFVNGFYAQFDNLVNLYNEKFAVPATAIRKDLIDKGKITPADFDDRLDWIYYELWHHQGRRARHGAAMQGPDYAWWHGIYEVAKTFYMEFLPEVKHVAGPELYDATVKKHLGRDVRHEWFIKGMSKEQLEKIRKFYEERYGGAQAR